MEDTVVRSHNAHNAQGAERYRAGVYNGLYLLVSDHMGHTSTTRLRLYLPEIETGMILARV